MASNFTSGMLYESAYSIPFNWMNHLPECVYKYHELVWKETNAPIELHMGVVLPFVSACLGIRTKGHFLTRPSVLNLFWINVAALGVGKSVTRHHFISEPLDYSLRTVMEQYRTSKFRVLLGQVCTYSNVLTMCLQKKSSSGVFLIDLQE